MINEDLIKYIDAQKLKGVSREDISLKLSNAGWKTEDINEGLEKFFPVSSPTPAFTPPEPLKPNLMPKVVGPAGALPIKKIETTPNLNSNQAQDPRVSSFDSFRPEQKAQPMVTANIMSPGPLPQGAVIASYRKDYQNLETISGEPKSHILRSIIITIFILLILGGGGVIFASIKGYINLPFEIPFFKPTPEVAMAKMMGNLSKVQSAHVDTDINFSLDTSTTYKEISVASGTSTGEEASYTTKPQDQKNEFNVKVSAITDYDNTDPSSSKSDTKIKLKFPADLLGIGEIESEFIFIGEDFYLRLPDIDFIKQFAGDTKWIYINKSDLSDKEFMAPVNTIAPFVGTYDLEKQKKLKALFADSDFMGDITEVGVEQIENDSTYHYQIVIGKSKIKNFVMKAIDIIDDPDMTSGKEDMLNSLDSMKDIKVDMWITKGTYLLRKFAVVLSNESLDSHDTYDTKSNMAITITQLVSKINEKVTVSAPVGAKTIKEIQKEYEAQPEVINSKIKANIYGFEPEAELFFDTHNNSYGKINTGNSCSTPVKDSVFENSIYIKSVLELSGGVGSCYSNLKAYAVSIPLSGGTNMCMDSKGTKKETKIPLTGTLCK